MRWLMINIPMLDVWACLVAACERYYCRFFVLGDLQAGDAQDVFGGERGTLEIGVPAENEVP